MRFVGERRFIGNSREEQLEEDDNEVEEEEVQFGRRTGCLGRDVNPKMSKCDKGMGGTKPDKIKDNCFVFRRLLCCMRPNAAGVEQEDEIKEK